MAIDSAIGPIVFFDGVCNLCSASVRFIIRRDTRRNFRFASLQSEFAKQTLINFNVGEQPESIVLVKGEKIYLRSDAVMEISRGMNGAWPLLYVFSLVPRFIRNGVYNFVARNRYRWWGKTDTCWVPTPELNARFIS